MGRPIGVPRIQMLQRGTQLLQVNSARSSIGDSRPKLLQRASFAPRLSDVPRRTSDVSHVSIGEALHERNVTWTIDDDDEDPTIIAGLKRASENPDLEPEKEDDEDRKQRTLSEWLRSSRVSRSFEEHGGDFSPVSIGGFGKRASTFERQ